MLVSNSSRVELRLNCTLPAATDTPPLSTSGQRLNFSLDVLATHDPGVQFARYGYSLGANQFFISSHGMLTTSSKVQKGYANVPACVTPLQFTNH